MVDKSNTASSLRARINAMPDEELISLLARDPQFLGWLDKPSLAVQIAAVQANPNNLTSLKRPHPQLWAAVKKDVIRHLLEIVASSDYYPSYYIRMELNYLHKKKVDWPELKMIEKSLGITRKGKTVTEDEYAGEEDRQARYEESFIRGIKQRLWANAPGGWFWVIKSVINDMRGMKLSYPKIWQVLDEHKEDILIMCNQELVDSDGMVGVHAGLENIVSLVDVGVDWPDLKQMVERNKRNILRATLEETKLWNKTDYDDEPPHMYQALRVLKVTWPELDIIGKSIGADAKLRETTPVDEMAATREGVWLDDLLHWLKEETVDLNLIAWSLVMIGREGRDQNLAELKPFLERNKTPIIKSMLKAIAKALARDSGIRWNNREIQELVRGAQLLGLEWPEIDLMAKSILAPKKVDEADLQVAQGAWFRTFLRIVNNYPVDLDGVAWSLLQMGRDQKNPVTAEHSKWIEQKKDTIVTAMLRAIALKTGAVFNQIELKQMIRGARELGVDWPELDVMERSVGKLPPLVEDEDADRAELMAQGRSAVTDIFKEKMKWSRGIYYVLHDMELWNLKAKDFPEIAAIIDANKHAIVKEILKSLIEKDGVEWAEMLATRLRKIGVNWPELDTVEKSLSAIAVSESISNDDTASVHQYYFSLVRDLAKDNPNWDDIGWSLSRIGRYNIRQDPSVIRDSLQKYKTRLIKAILIAVANQRAINWRENELEWIIKGATRLQTGWPEIDQINRSLQSDSVTRSRRLGEAASEPSIKDQIMREIAEHLAAGAYDKLWEPVTELDWDEMTHELKPLLDTHKRGIITNLLKMRTKHPTYDVVAHFPYFIEGLRHLGVNWPELAVIEASIDQDRTQLRMW